MTSRRLRIQFALTLLAVMFALWVFRLHEGYVEASVLLGMWLALPAAAWGMGLLLRKRAVAEAFYVLSAIDCVVYALCCLGHDDGNNLPLLFVPLSLFVFGCCFVPGLMIYRAIAAIVGVKATKAPAHEPSAALPSDTHRDAPPGR